MIKKIFHAVFSSIPGLICWLTFSVVMLGVHIKDHNNAGAVMEGVLGACWGINLAAVIKQKRRPVATPTSTPINDAAYASFTNVGQMTGIIGVATPTPDPTVAVDPVHYTFQMGSSVSPISGLIGGASAHIGQYADYAGDANSGPIYTSIELYYQRLIRDELWEPLKYKVREQQVPGRPVVDPDIIAAIQAGCQAAIEAFDKHFEPPAPVPVPVPFVYQLAEYTEPRVE